MENKFKRTTVTSALPYANGPVHIGHLAGHEHEQCNKNRELYQHRQTATHRTHTVLAVHSQNSCFN